MPNSLPKVFGEYKFNYNLSHLTWFKTGGPAQVLFKPKNIPDLQSFLKQNSSNQKNPLPITVLGAGSNVIIRDGGVDGVVIKLGKEFNNIELLGDKIKVGASCLNFHLSKFCANASLKNFEFLIGIPGTIGGGVAMNAGAYGLEFKDIILEIDAIDFYGNFHKFTNEEIGFKYRNNGLPKGLIFLNAVFKTQSGCHQAITSLMDEIARTRNLTQPVKMRTGGSTFANPGVVTQAEFKGADLKAWELIDSTGLRGYNVNDAAISDLHCNFMINRGNAKASDLESLGEYVRKKVFEKFGIMLEWEIKRIGRPFNNAMPRITIN